MMLPYSAMAFDYVTYQSRPGMPTPSSNGPLPSELGMSNGSSTSFTHSWLVPNQDFGDANITIQHNQQAIDPGHVMQ